MDRRIFLGGLAGLVMAPVATAASAASFTGLSATAAKRALDVYAKARAASLSTSSVYTVIDYTRPSDQKRLWTVDLSTGRLLHHLLVSHGSGSGFRVASRFSDTPESHQSSLGLARAAERYQGKHGLSLRLDGLEPGINGRMRPRAIVIHGASYATAKAVETNRAAEGTPRLGRSQGCPAVDPAHVGALIQHIEGGGLIFGYHDHPDYWAATRFR